MDALVTRMDLVQDLVLQLRWNDDSIVSHQEAILYRNLRRGQSIGLHKALDFATLWPFIQAILLQFLAHCILFLHLGNLQETCLCDREANFFLPHILYEDV